MEVSTCEKCGGCISIWTTVVGLKRNRRIASYYFLHFICYSIWTKGQKKKRKKKNRSVLDEMQGRIRGLNVAA